MIFSLHLAVFKTAKHPMPNYFNDLVVISPIIVIIIQYKERTLYWKYLLKMKYPRVVCNIGAIHQLIIEVDQGKNKILRCAQFM